MFIERFIDCSAGCPLLDSRTGNRLIPTNTRVSITRCNSLGPSLGSENQVERDQDLPKVYMFFNIAESEAGSIDNLTVTIFIHSLSTFWHRINHGEQMSRFVFPCHMFAFTMSGPLYTRFQNLLPTNWRSVSGNIIHLQWL